MSFHLIETRTTATARRWSVAPLVSVLMHWMLLVSLCTPAPATPAPVTEIIWHCGVSFLPLSYVTPAEPQAPVPPDNSTSDGPYQQGVPVFPEVTLVDIPPVTTDPSAILLRTDLYDPRGWMEERANRVSTTNGGTSARGTRGTDANAVLDAQQADGRVTAPPGYPTPRYPEVLQVAGLEQTVRAQFVVDTLGHIEPGSMEFINNPHPLFAAAVRDALAHAEFRPAETAGHRVRERVAQSFVFAIVRQ